MAYKLMISLINLKRTSKEELLNKADVFYAAGRLSDSEYAEIVARINATE